MWQEKEESDDSVEESEWESYDEEEDEEIHWKSSRSPSFFKDDLKETDELPKRTGSMSRLPDEIFMNILSRLPVKFLIRNRLVSKSWYFVLKHPRFAKFHLTMSAKESKSVIFLDKLNGDYYFANHLVFEKLESLVRMHFPRIPERLMVEKISSCNGLVFSNEPPFYVSNPITGEYVQLPKPNSWRRHVALSGIGFDSVAKEYKVIRVLETRGLFSDTDVQIHTIGSGEWRWLPRVPYTFKGSQSSAFVNGVFHWIGFKNGKCSAGDVVITFKIGTEEWGQIPLPRSLGKRTEKQYLLVLGECLSVVDCVSDKHIQVWLLKEIGGKRFWVNDYVIRNIDVFTEMHDTCGGYEPIQLLKNGEILLLCSHQYLGYYEPKTKVFRQIEIFGTDSCRYALLPFAHMESFVSPRSIAGITKSNGKDKCSSVEEDYAAYGSDADDSSNEDEEDDYEDDTEENLKEQEFPQLGGAMSKLPGEIFMDILSRVPLESLSECRWVSKAWYTVIRHPRFVKMNHTRSIENKDSQSIIFLDKLNEGYYFADHQVFDRLKSSARFYMPRIPDTLMVEIDSCNGLVFSHEPPFYISNPITGEYIKLPKPPRWRRPSTVSGFGFDSNSNEYKVIRVLEQEGLYADTDVQIYTLGSDGWRWLPSLPYTFLDSRSSVFVNGAFHWIGCENDKSMAPDLIIFFKIATEEFGTVPLPPRFVLPTDEFLPYLLVLGECLCAVNCLSDEHIEVWVMEEYGDHRSWVKQYVIRNIKSLDGPYELIKLMKNGEILLLCSHRYLGYYNPKTKIFRPIRIYGTNSRKYALHPLLHVGSLISPKSVGKMTKSKHQGETGSRRRYKTLRSNPLHDPEIMIEQMILNHQLGELEAFANPGPFLSSYRNHCDQ